MENTWLHYSGATRTEGLGQSIFSIMTKLAIEFDAVNLGQGFPDFDGPEWLISKFEHALRSGRNQYAPMHGTSVLRKAIATYQKEYWSLEWDEEDEITVTAGATEALFSSILALLNPGDEVVLFEPFYDAHLADVQLAGGIPRFVTLRKPDFRINGDALYAAISEKTRMIILNSPHNPTGRVFSKEELALVASAAHKHDLLVLSDEVYEFLTFDNITHQPFAAFPEMRDRTITISSAGKTFGMTGWKIGYVMAAGALTAAIRKVHQFATFAVNTPAQLAVAQGLTLLPDYLTEYRKQYRQKRDMVLTELSSAGYRCITPEGTYFIMIDVPASSGCSDVEFAEHLIREHRIAVIPPSLFYGKSEEGTTMLRICFAKQEETLAEGLRRLRQALIAV